MIFRQLYEPLSSTYTYLLGCEETGQAVLIDPVIVSMKRDLAEFKQIMVALNLPYPKFIDHAVPGNKQCGVCPSGLPENLEKYCKQMTESPQG